MEFLAAQRLGAQLLGRLCKNRFIILNLSSKNMPTKTPGRSLPSGASCPSGFKGQLKSRRGGPKPAPECSNRGSAAAPGWANYFPYLLIDSISKGDPYCRLGRDSINNLKSSFGRQKAVRTLSRDLILANGFVVLSFDLNWHGRMPLPLRTQRWAGLTEYRLQG